MARRCWRRRFGCRRITCHVTEVTLAAMPQKDDPKLITCIYCKERRPPSREHLLQRGLGGDLVARIQCAQCNTGFSDIDGAIAQRSLVAMDRTAFTPLDGFEARLGGDHFLFDEEAEIWCDVALVNGMQPLLLPQVHLMSGQRGEPTLGILAGDRLGLDQLRDFVDAKLASNALRNMYVKIGPEKFCNSPHLTMHREGDGFVRVPKVGDAGELFDTLERGWRKAIDGNLASVERGEIEQTTVENPSINVTLRMRLDDIF